MGFEGVSDLEVGAPDFQSSVPSNTGEVWLEWLSLGSRFGNWGVSDARDPIGVVGFFGFVFAISQSVPKSDFSVSSGRQDLSVIWGEGNGEDFFGVSGEHLRSFSGSEVPKSEGFVPTGGDNEVVILGEGQVRDEVVVSGQ